MVTMGDGVKTIGVSAFEGCSSLASVMIGKNLMVIEKKAFYKCTALKSITIPEKVVSIGDQAFYGCKKLQKMNLKTKRLKKVGKKAIKGIKKRAVIRVPKSRRRRTRDCLLPNPALKNQ